MTEGNITKNLTASQGRDTVELVEAVIQIDPVAVTARESIKRFRSWAAGRCLAADRPSVYQVTGVSHQFAPGLHRVNPLNN